MELPLTKLSKSIVETISTEITSKYSKSQLAEMTILDVGGYDGWILVQLQKELNFKLAVCVEPRLKNIQKGEFARKYYGILTNVKFIQGELNSLDQVLDNKFDFVLCLGVLHHLESTPIAIKSLANYCLNTMIISSATIERPKKSVTKLLKLMNLKDIAYLNSAQDFAIAGFKFETPYFDGSTTESAIVNLPEENLIIMSLSSNGFHIKRSLNSQSSKYLASFTKSHGEQATFIVACKNQNSITQEKNFNRDILQYELNFLFTIPRIEILSSWSSLFENYHYQVFKTRAFNKFFARHKLASLLMAFASRHAELRISKVVLNLAKVQPAEVAIIQSIEKAPITKSNFELAKHLLVNGQLNEAKDLLQKLTNTPNCDWRVFYRSCYLLACIAEIQNDSISCGHYLNLLKIANPLFPITIVVGTNWIKSQM